jgi:spermidine synthase
MNKNATNQVAPAQGSGANEKTAQNSSGISRSVFAVFFLVFFSSGVSALIYEITWTRRLTLVFGNTVYSVSTVLAAFMGGLALGSLLLGRFVDKRRDPIRIYGVLEIGIGATALLIPLALSAVNPAYQFLYNKVGFSSTLMSLTRFIINAGILIVPTTFMGATLPVMSKVIVRRIEKRGIGIGSLYSMNTFGAMVGCFLSGFVLLSYLGITRSEQVAATINICIGLIAFVLHRRIGDISTSEDGNTLAESPEEPIYGKGSLRLVLFIMGVSGALALAYEVLWVRILVLLLGSSIYSFSMILVVYLFGLTAGSLLSARFVDNSKRPLQIFGWLEVFIGLSVLAGFLFFQRLPFEAYALKVEPRHYLANNFLSTFAVVFPPTLMMGAIFPFAVSVYTRSLGSLGRQTGAVYAVNTIGAVVGSFAAGFILIPILGSKNSMMLLVLLSFAAGLSLFYLAMKKEGMNKLNWLAGAVVILPLAGFSMGNDLMEELSMKFLYDVPGDVVNFNEDATATVAVVETEGNYRFLVVNGVAMTVLCTETQLMAHLPIALSSGTEDVLTICFGMGSSFVSARRAGANVDFVELCPHVVEVFEYFQADPSMLEEPGVGKIIADGRNYTLLSDKTYDTIIIDPPPPPWSAGTVNLYTTEFYELCKKRLNREGIICQWLPTILSCFTEPQFKMLLRTFQEVFPHTTVWGSPNNYGAFLIGTPEKLEIDEESFMAYFDTPAIKDDLSLYSSTPVDGKYLLSLFALDEDAARSYAGSEPVMNDDNPWIEFPLFEAGPSAKIMEVETLAAESVE